MSTETTAQRARISITGTVRWDDGGDPVRGVVVELVARGHGDDVLLKAVTDDKGGFVVVLYRPAGGLDMRIRTESGDVVHQVKVVDDFLLEGELQLVVGVPGARRDLADPRRRARRRARRTVTVGSTDLDAAALGELTQDELRLIARAQVDRDVAKEVGDLLDRLSPDLNPLRPGPRVLCSAPTWHTIDEIIRLKRWPRELVVEVDRILTMRDSGFATATHDCGNFSITYQTTGPAAVDSSTAALDVVDPGTTNVIHTIAAGGQCPPTSA